MPIYLIDKIKQKNGKNFKLLDAADVGMESGKSVEEAFGNVTEKFRSNTQDATPTQVADAISKGNTVLISHTDSTYGIIMFASGICVAGLNIVAGSVAFEYGGTLYNAGLVGDLQSNTWKFSAEEIGGTGMEELEGVSVLEPDKFYVFGEVSSLELTLEEAGDGKVHEYAFEFIPLSESFSINIPGVQWATELLFEANKTYQASIVRGLGVLLSV